MSRDVTTPSRMPYSNPAPRDTKNVTDHGNRSSSVTNKHNNNGPLSIPYIQFVSSAGALEYTGWCIKKWTREDKQPACSDDFNQHIVR